MSDLTLIAQWLLAAVLLVSAIAKLTDRAATADAVVEFGVPERLRWAAPAIPVVELLLVVLLVIPATARWGAFGAIGLLSVFSVAIIVNLARGRRPDCNCFGRLTTGPIGAATLVRNGLLLALAAIAAVPTTSSAGDVLSGISVPVAFAVVALALVAAVLGGLVWLVLELWKQQARLLERLGALEAGVPDGGTAPVTVGPPIGSPAPDVRGTDGDASTTTLSQQWSAGRTTLVVFGDPSCRACAELHPDLTAWLDADRDHRHLVVVSRTAATDVPDGATVFVEEDREASIAYGVRGTPSALFVDGAGSVSSVLAEGAEAIRPLLSSTPAPTHPVSGAGPDRGPAGSAPVRFRARPVRTGDVLSLDALPADLALDGSTTDPTLLVFWNERCSHCRGMSESLAERSDRQTGDTTGGTVRLTFVVPSPDQATAVIDRLPDSAAVVDRDMKTNLALGVPGTPSAALVGPDRRLVADLAIGPEAVLALYDRATGGSDATGRRRRAATRAAR